MGDIVLTTDNPIFLKGCDTSRNVITYEKQPVPSHKITLANFVKTDIRGLGTAVGSFSNCATIIEAMRPIFNKENQEDQRQELLLRKKILREIIGDEIDKIKGVAAPQLPREWKHFEKINEDDTDDVKADKYKHNSLVISKKPYFFRYLYPELNKRYKQYENSYNVISKDLFELKLKQLIKKQDKTEAEKTLVRRYQKYSPLIVSNCIMNTLCREVETTDFDIKFAKDNISMLPTYSDRGFAVDSKKFNVFRDCYRLYNNKKTAKMINMSFAENKFDDDVREVYFNILDTVKDEIKEKISELELSHEECFFYAYELSKSYTHFNWSFCWDVFEDFILDCIPSGDSFFPVKDEEGVEYLGQKYSLKNINDTSWTDITTDDFDFTFEEEVYDFD